MFPLGALSPTALYGWAVAEGTWQETQSRLGELTPALLKPASGSFWTEKKEGCASADPLAEATAAARSHQPADGPGSHIWGPGGAQSSWRLGSSLQMALSPSHQPQLPSCLRGQWMHRERLLGPVPAPSWPLWAQGPAGHRTVAGGGSALPPAPLSPAEPAPTAGRDRDLSRDARVSVGSSPKSRGLFAEWQDPEFMRDVEAATGVDLGSSGPSGRGRGKRRRRRGLTDLKQQADTARARIAKKVFAK